LAEASKEIAPVFKPVGFGEHWEFVAALIPGTLAKEVVISSLGTIYGVEEKSGKINKFNLKEKTVNEIKELFIATKESFSNLLNLNIKTLQSENFSSTLKEKIQNQFSSAKAVLSYLIFILLYIPCVSTMAAIKNEFGWKLMIFEVISLPVIAYIFSFLFYKLL
jgi:ferrous iron transport protein B